MLNKPIFIAIILNVALFLFSMIFMIFNNRLITNSLILISIFAFSIYTGFSYTKYNKKALSKKDRLKISSYFFVFWFLFISSIVILMIYLSPIKNISSYVFSNPKQIAIILHILLMNFVTFGIISLILYWTIDLGCKLWIKRFS